MGSEYIAFRFAKKYKNSWPDFICSPEEILQQLEPVPMVLRPTPKQITQCWETCKWLRFEGIEKEEGDIIWMRACRKPWKVICWKIGCGRTTAVRKWKSGLHKIAIKLNENNVPNPCY